MRVELATGCQDSAYRGEAMTFSFIFQRTVSIPLCEFAMRCFFIKGDGKIVL